MDAPSSTSTGPGNGPIGSMGLASLDDVIAHFGIKGMKWGVRKDRAKTATSEDASRHAENLQKVKAGGTKALSTKELQDLVTRMNLEQQYARLNPSAGSVATKMVTDILVQVGKEQMKTLTSKGASKLVDKAIKKK